MLYILYRIKWPSRCCKYIWFPGIKSDRNNRVISPFETVNWLRPISWAHQLDTQNYTGLEWNGMTHSIPIPSQFHHTKQNTIVSMIWAKFGSLPIVVPYINLSTSCGKKTTFPLMVHTPENNKVKIHENMKKIIVEFHNGLHARDSNILVNLPEGIFPNIGCN